MQNNKTQAIYLETEELNLQETDEDKNIESFLKNKYNKEFEIWQLEIPRIDLIAPIAQDTTQDVMREFVGHFINTSFWKGNVGLAAHNRRISN